MSINRNIYKFNDGTKDVYVDPTDLDYRLIKAFEKDDISIIEQNLSLPTDSEGKVIQDEVDNGKLTLFMEACHRLDPLVREAFQLAPFNQNDGTGMLSSDVIKLYLDYTSWKDGLKKNTD